MQRRPARPRRGVEVEAWHLLRGLLGHSAARVHLHYLGTPHFPQFPAAAAAAAAASGAGQKTPLRLDYFLSDASLTPPDVLSQVSPPLSRYSSERLLVMPHYMVFQPPSEEDDDDDDDNSGGGSGGGYDSSHAGYFKDESEESTASADSVFLFACFNQGKKIDPALFGVWMDILTRVNRHWARFGREARLWLPQIDPGQRRAPARNASSNTSSFVEVKSAVRGALVAEAAARGVPERWLVFSRRVEGRGEHLARMARADLALDTGYGSATRGVGLVGGGGYSAGSVAVEALLQGIPLLVLASGVTVAERQELLALAPESLSLGSRLPLVFSAAEDNGTLQR
mgnify:CR=1 FL=1